MRKSIATLFLLAGCCFFFAFLSGCEKTINKVEEKTINKPNDGIVIDCIGKSVAQVIMESNKFFENVPVMEVISWTFVGDLKDSPLDKKSIVTKRDKDGVDRQMWSTVVEATADCALRVMGTPRVYHSIKHVKYTLYIYENAQGDFLWEKGAFEVL